MSKRNAQSQSRRRKCFMYFNSRHTLCTAHIKFTVCMCLCICGYDFFFHFISSCIAFALFALFVSTQSSDQRTLSAVLIGRSVDFMPIRARTIANARFASIFPIFSPVDFVFERSPSTHTHTLHVRRTPDTLIAEQHSVACIWNLYRYDSPAKRNVCALQITRARHRTQVFFNENEIPYQRRQRQRQRQPHRQCEIGTLIVFRLELCR